MEERDFKLFTSLRYDLALLAVPDVGPATAAAGWNRAKPSPFYMLDLHRDRMLRAARHFGWVAAADALVGEAGLATLEAYLLEAVAGCSGGNAYRVKVEIGRDGAFSHQKSPVPDTSLGNLFPAYLPPPLGEGEAEDGLMPSKIPEYEILVDTERTPGSEFTHHKTTRRAVYDGARARVRPAPLAPADRKEVLLVNEDGLVMEGSISTCYFWRGGRWVTPFVVGPSSLAEATTVGSGGNAGTTRQWALERYVYIQSSRERTSKQMVADMLR